MPSEAVRLLSARGICVTSTFSSDIVQRSMSIVASVAATVPSSAESGIVRYGTQYRLELMICACRQMAEFELTKSTVTTSDSRISPGVWTDYHPLHSTIACLTLFFARCRSQLVSHFYDDQISFYLIFFLPLPMLTNHHGNCNRKCQRPSHDVTLCHVISLKEGCGNYLGLMGNEKKGLIHSFDF